MEMDRIRYGIIGTGGCGKGKHLSSYCEIPGVEIVAVCDILEARAEAAAETFGAESVYTDYQEMLAPNDIHAPATIAALEAGCHVHCEKPASVSPELVREMVAAKDRSGRKLMIGLNNRFTPWAQFARAYAAAGNLGRIYHAKCGWKRRRGIPGKGGWFTTKARSGGGPLIDLGVHFIDVCNYIMGFPEPTAVAGRTYCEFGENTGKAISEHSRFGDTAAEGVYDVEDLAVGFIRYADGCSLEVEFSWASNIAREYNYVELYGDRGGLEYRGGRLTLFSEFQGTVLDTVPTLAADGAWGRAECEHYVDCILHDREVMAPPEEAVKVMQIIDALYRSAEQDAEVRIGAEAITG
jgi:predicted dehydrogenase